MANTQEQNPDIFIDIYPVLILNFTETENNFTNVFERWRQLINIESEMDRQTLGLNGKETEDPFEIDEENQYITRI
jgi:hypothetical protein